MGAYGELFGRKLNNDGDPAGPAGMHDPGGPLDLDQGVVYLAPPRRDHDRQDTEEPDPQ